MAGKVKIGLISNPLSRANRRSGGVAARVTPGADICTAEPRSHEDLTRDLIRFAREGVDLIAIDGGDGTVRDVVTDIHLAYGDRWPRFALLPSGKTNVIAADVGHFGSGDRGWQRLIAARDGGTLGSRQRQCAALEISWPNRQQPVRRGFLLGCAAFSEGVRMANETIHPLGIFKGLAVAMTIAGTLWRNLGQGGRDAGEAGTILVDGRQIDNARHFLTMASTLDRLTLGLRPFWKEGQGPVNWLDVPSPAKHVLAAFWLLAFGKRQRWMARAGYAGGRATGIDLKFDRPFVLDGELYDPHGHVRINASQPITFLRR